MFFNGLKVHFIGIGGIGVSGLARFLKAQGAIVSGSDIAATSITNSLISEGIAINIPHNPAVIADKDLIIHSAIIKDSNIEIMESKRLNKKIFSRKDALLELLKERQVLSICAAHGKSSTAAIMAAILPQAGAIIGAISKEFDSNVRVSQSKILIFEADESDRSFLNSNPYVSIVLNAEAEHLESYDGDFERLKNAYLEFIKLGHIGVLNLSCDVVDSLFRRLLESSEDSNSDKNCVNVNIKDSKLTKIITFNPKNDIKNIRYTLRDYKPYTAFSLRDFGEFEVYGIGSHNAQNASMAILSALEFSSLDSIKKNILNFKGIKKRFDILQHLDSMDIRHAEPLQSKGEASKFGNLDSIESSPCIIDDYAHHPTEISATLSSAKIYAKLLFEKLQNLDSIESNHLCRDKATTESKIKKHLNVTKDSIHITAIFQPHKYSRLRDNLEAFKGCFKDCDSLVILPVWAAGESEIKFNFSEIFAKYKPIFASRVRRNGALLELLDSKNNVIKTLDSGIIIGLGAGDITYQLRGEK